MSDRPILATIDSFRTGSTSSVTVTLAFEDRTSSGTASAEIGEDASAQLHLVAEAATRAAQEGVHGGWALQIQAAAVQQVGDEEVCLVQIADLDAGDVLFGIAGVRREDAEKVMARAVLDAVNRRLIRKLEDS